MRLLRAVLLTCLAFVLVSGGKGKLSKKIDKLLTLLDERADEIVALLNAKTEEINAVVKVIGDEVKDLGSKVEKTCTAKDPVDNVEKTCPNGWVKRDKSCYIFSNAKYSYTNAKNYCLQQGSHLVIIEDSGENEFLRSNIIYKGNEVWWIGLINANGRWVWDTTGQVSSFYAWGSNEPDGQQCVTMHSARNFYWADDLCHLNYLFICEKEL